MGERAWGPAAPGGTRRDSVDEPGTHVPGYGTGTGYSGKVAITGRCRGQLKLAGGPISLQVTALVVPSENVQPLSVQNDGALAPLVPELKA